MSDYDRDERIALPLDPEEALKALLAVDPGACDHEFVPEAEGGGHSVGGQPLHQSGTCSNCGAALRRFVESGEVAEEPAR